MTGTTAIAHIRGPDLLKSSGRPPIRMLKGHGRPGYLHKEGAPP